MKILVVDNHPMMLKFMTDFLEKKGHQVRTAEDGVAALDILKTFIPDVMFIDLVMPNISGDKLCRIVRRTPKLEGTYLVILSAVAAEEGEEFQKFGANACIAKGPFNTMSEHILGLLDRLEGESPDTSSARIIGLDKIPESQITEELLSSKRHTDAVLGNICEGIIELTLDGKIVYANSLATSLLAATEEALLGSSFVEAFEKGQRKRVSELLDENEVTSAAITEDSPVDLNGKQLSMKILPISDKGNRTKVVVLHDLTERKLAEKALKESEEKYRTVVESSSDAVLMIDKERRIASCNQAFLNLFGYGRPEVEGKSIRMIHCSDDSFRLFAEHAYPVIDAVGTFRAEWDFKHKDGTIFPVETVTSKVTYADGSLRGYVAMIRDITERKQAEAVLRESEERYRTVLESIDEGYFEFDLKGNLTFFNDSLRKTLGYPEHRLTGLNYQEYTSREVADQIAQIFNTVYETGRPVKNAEHEVFSEDGTKKIICFSISPMKNADGEAIGFRGIARDVTARRVLEMHLSQAQKLESIGQLAAGIAHEINTPTQYVGDNTRFLKDTFGDLHRLFEKYGELVDASKEAGLREDLIREAKGIAEDVDLPYLTEEIPKAIEQSLEGVERISRIVGSMKAFSHPGTYAMTAVDINKAIESTVTVARNEWKYVAEMMTEYDPSLPLVPCLPGDFNQVILNLIINATDAISEVVGDGSSGKGSIKVSTHHKGNWAEIRISDTGTGIRDEIRSKIFDPFFTTKKVGKGTGQGLAISHSVIVDKHKGTLNFETEAGKGTTFVIRLPINEEGI